MSKVKTKSVFVHSIEYYKKTKLVKTDILCELQKDQLANYWKLQLEFLGNADNNYVELDNYIAVTKCVRDYDYQVHRIVETFQLDNN